MAILGMTTTPQPRTSHYNETVRALSEITDAGLFEHLATAVLRAAKPELYGHLTQTGINAEGKPVKSPVDAWTARRITSPGGPPRAPTPVL